jgi:hypothetical protein
MEDGFEKLEVTGLKAQVDIVSPQAEKVRSKEGDGMKISA